MSTFYYLAVSNADSRRSTGQIDAESESAARRELNKLGFSVLMLGKEPLSQKNEYSTSIAFEFEALDKSSKKVTGTIDAADDIAAYNRLIGEFNFQVEYLCEAAADESTKATARAAGLAPLLARLADQNQSIEAAKPKNLIDQVEAFAKKELEIAEHALATPKKKLQLNLEKNEEIAVPVVPPTAKNGPVSLEEKLAEPIPKALNTNTPERIQLESGSGGDFFESGFTKTQKNINNTVAEASPSWKSQLEQLIFGKKEFPILSLIKIWLTAKTSEERQIAWSALATAWRKKQESSHTLTRLSGLIDEVQSSISTEKYWQLAADLTGWLAAVFFVYFAVANLALHYEFGSLTELARITVASSTLIPFLAIVFISIRLLIELQAQIQSERPLKLGFLFILPTLLITLAGANLVY